MPAFLYAAYGLGIALLVAAARLATDSFAAVLLAELRAPPAAGRLAVGTPVLGSSSVSVDELPVASLGLRERKRFASSSSSTEASPPSLFVVLQSIWATPSWAALISDWWTDIVASAGGGGGATGRTKGGGANIY